MRTCPLLVAAMAAGAVLSPAAAAPAGATDTPPGIQRLVTLERAHRAFASPDRAAQRVGYVRAHRPITRTRTVLPVLDTHTGTNGQPWLRVRLPGRPNARSGWISERSTRAGRTSLRLHVDLGRRQVVVYRRGEIVRRFPAVVGARATPTPAGRFFVEETVALGAHRVGGPFALALSARSDVLQRFAGGPGQIAIHGMDNVGGTPGTAASHGCLRLRTAAITWLASRVGPGVPVTIGRERAREDSNL